MGKILTSISLWQENHGVCLTLLFFPAFSSVYAAYLSTAQSKGQGSFLITNVSNTNTEGPPTPVHMLYC